MSNSSPSEKSLAFFFTKHVLYWAIARIADKCQRARLLRAPAFAHGVNSFDRGSRFSIFENAPVDQSRPLGATSLNLFHRTKIFLPVAASCAKSANRFNN